MKFNLAPKDINIEQARVNLNIGNRALKIDQEILNLILAVSAIRTRVHYGQKHVCRKHELKVDKHYINTCDLINEPG